jgi:hypothetical protein
MFFEKGINLLLYNQSDRSYIGVIIDDEANLFYNFSIIGDINKRSNLLFNFNNNEDNGLLYALSGIVENPAIEDVHYLENLSEYDKRKLINTMFALNGYSFSTEQWQIYFGKYSWYKPNNAIKNDPGILSIRQKRLLDFLNK